MRRTILFGLTLALACVSGAAGQQSALDVARARLSADAAALDAARPGYPFWRHVFLTPDGSVLYGAVDDGRLLARFPSRSDWSEGGRWEDASLAESLKGQPLDRDLSVRRDQMASLLESAVGPVIHNSSRGSFLLPNVRRYGGFLDEWATIYERFGVPAEIGLAQAIVESGLNGRARSKANALGLCQFLKGNWARLDRLTPHVIEIQNQTTQAAFCAAYLTVLATKYGSFIPALSEHHAGVANVAKVLVNGERLGASDVRARYFAGAEFARDLWTLSSRQFRDVVGTYGARSFLYAEMVFGNAGTVSELRASTPQEKVYAMRTDRALDISEITRRSGVSEQEVKRFNPALFRQVPRGATLYLPKRVESLGRDATFWHRDAPESFTRVLSDFVALDATPEEWEAQAFEDTLDRFRRRFRETRSEEGVVMDAILAYVTQEVRATRRVMAQYRASERVQETFERGVEQRLATPVSRDQTPTGR